jgi:lupus La protein
MADLKEKILKQVEFYFSDSNYPKDKFLRTQAAHDEEGCKCVRPITGVRLI